MDKKYKLRTILKSEYPEITQKHTLEEIASYCYQSIILSSSFFRFLANCLFLLIDLCSIMFYKKSFIRVDSHKQIDTWNRLRCLPGFKQFGDFLRTLSLMRLVEISGNNNEKI